MRVKDKIKVGTILDRKVYLRLKERAAREGRSISELLGAAIDRYTQPQPTDLKARQEAFDRMMSFAIPATLQEVKEVLEMDPYER